MTLDPDVADDRPDDRKDERFAKLKGHRGLLTQREVFEIYLYDPRIRPYLFGALGALAMLFLAIFLGGSDIGAVITLFFALATLAFRWTAGPVMLLFLLFYFQICPFGVPDPDTMFATPLTVRQTHFRIADMVLVFSALVYFRCQFRIFGLLKQAMPAETSFQRKGEHPVRRPTSQIEPVEIAWMVGTAIGLVLIGQFLWWVANGIDVVIGDDTFPLRWADRASMARYRRTSREAGEYTPGQNRFFVILGALFFGLLVARLVFGYWRLRTMTPAEGAMILTDTSWSESYRERVRVEKWRIWGIGKSAEARSKAVRAERGRKEWERARKGEERDDPKRTAARKREPERDRARGESDDNRDKTPPRRRR